MRSLRALPPAALSAALVLGAAAPPAGAQAPTLPYDHVHLRVPDPAAAADWYIENFGAVQMTEAPNRILFGSTRMMFLSGEREPSAGSSIDHIGFSVVDLEAKLEELDANGVEITTPRRDIPGLFELSFVEDPWGTRIEVVEDHELLGLHHVHLRSPDPEAMKSWLTDHFGGERRSMKGRIDGVFYRARGFSDMWILVSEGEATPSTEHVIDHIGWRVTDMDAKVAALEEMGVTVSVGPRELTLPNNSTLYYAYIDGPEGARFELVQRLVR